jgi:malonyl-CoA/methylmalonyl-CoA synthetase
MTADVHLPAGGEPLDLLAEGSLPAAWSRRWRADPGRVVLVDDAGGQLTAGELDRRSAAVASQLHAAGVRRGDRVVLSGNANFDTIIAHCAAMRAGFVVVPVNPAYPRRELELVLADARPRAAFVSRDEFRTWVGEIDPSIVLADPHAATPAKLAALDEVGPSDPALLCYTSGTTGTPKGALLSHGNLLAGAEAVRLAWRWTDRDRLILCLPLTHMHGLGVGLHGTLLAGASAIVLPKFDVHQVLAATDGATLLFGVPTMYARLAEAEEVHRLSRLRLCVSGSAALSAELHQQIEARSGQRILERYGMTETVLLVSNPYDGERRPGTVGLPLPGVELVLDASGEILVKGPSVFSGYRDQPDATRASFTADGWFRTGDIGAYDERGYLQIVGRSKELIISGGYNVYPREVEDVLRLYPGVIDVAVVGVASAEWGEVVTAFVEAHGALDGDALLAWAGQQLAPYKRPRAVYQLAALPRNNLGKVVRRELKPPT